MHWSGFQYEKAAAPAARYIAFFSLKWLKYAHSWTALFRAFSSHRQPSASLTKSFPSCCGFFITNFRQTNRTQHVTIIFNVD